MTLYELAGHPVSLEFTQQDLMKFWEAARAVQGPARKEEKTRAGLEAVLPGLLVRLSSQLPSFAERVKR